MAAFGSGLGLSTRPSYLAHQAVTPRWEYIWIGLFLLAVCYAVTKLPYRPLFFTLDFRWHMAAE
jgi:hypothetical protein